MAGQGYNVTCCEIAAQEMIRKFFDVTEKKFSIQDEIIDGRPLYLDAQATTSMVSKYLSVSIAVCGVEGWGLGCQVGSTLT